MSGLAIGELVVEAISRIDLHHVDFSIPKIEGDITIEDVKPSPIDDHVTYGVQE